MATVRQRMPRYLAVGVAIAVVVLLGARLRLERLAAGERIGISSMLTDEGIRFVDPTPGFPADLAGIRDGDILQAIGGQRITNDDEYFALASTFRSGQPVPFTLVRDGEQIEVEVRPGTPFHWFRFGAEAAVAFAYLALGILALLQSPEDIRARLLALFSWAVALEMAVASTSVHSFGWIFLSQSTYYLLSGLQMGLELHLASVIPTRSRWLETSKRLPWGFYAVGLTMGFLSWLTYVQFTFEVTLLPWSVEASDWALAQVGLPLWALGVLGILVHQALHAREVRQRSQAIMVILGTLPWVLYIVLGAIPMDGSMPTWLVAAEPLIFISYPLVIFVAIFRFHLFDIELVVRRGLVYTSLTAALTVVFFLSVGALGVFASQLVGFEFHSVWLVGAAALLLGLLFAPLRQRLQFVIDRKVFPERVAIRKRLADLAAGLPPLGSLPSMGRHLVAELCGIFDVRSATLLVADPKSRLLVTLSSTAVDVGTRFEQSFLLQADDPGLDRVQRAGRPLRASQLASTSASLAQRLHAFEADLVVPLVSGKNLVGILLLGGKTSDEPYRAEELELLTLLGHNMASVLENVRLFESATYEGLTGLRRREAILETLEAETQRADRYRRPLTVGMADIDRFKRVNDELGHLAGDALLKRVAQTLAGALRASDTIGRYGGEEFLFVLPETAMKDATAVAEKLRAAVEGLGAAEPGSTSGPVTISIGLASAGHGEFEENPSAEALIAEADENLLEAKRAGRNRVVPAPS